MFTDASELSSLRRENDESRILLQLDKDLISEYDALIQESDSQLSEKEQLLLRVTRMLQSIQEEKQRQEEELRHCKKRVGSVSALQCSCSSMKTHQNLTPLRSTRCRWAPYHGFM